MLLSSRCKKKGKVKLNQNKVPLVTDDDFTPFLRWLSFYEGFSKDQIIQVVSEPYKYCEEYERFLNEE